MDVHSPNNCFHALPQIIRGIKIIFAFIGRVPWTFSWRQSRSHSLALTGAYRTHPAEGPPNALIDCTSTSLQISSSHFSGLDGTLSPSCRRAPPLRCPANRPSRSSTLGQAESVHELMSSELSIVTTAIGTCHKTGFGQRDSGFLQHSVGK